MHASPLRIGKLAVICVPILAAATLAVGTSAIARPSDAKTNGSGSRTEAVVGGRQAGFKLTLASFLGLRAAITRGDDPKTMVLPATAIAAWGHAIPGAFPADVQSPLSKALPSIASDRAGFEARAADMAAAAAQLATLAKAGDAGALNAQWEVLKNSCAACHDKYRAEEKR